MTDKKRRPPKNNPENPLRPTLRRWLPLFIRAMESRHKVLPEETLQATIKSILDKREVLMHSASRFGTPQYFFDEPSLTSQIARFHNTFSKHLGAYQAFFAVKSNCFRGLCKRAVEEGMGLDVSSGMELALANSLGCERIVFSGPGKNDRELELAMQNRKRVTLLLDSAGELERLCPHVKRENDPGNPLRLGIRIKSGPEAGWDKFGIPLEDLGTVFSKASRVKGVKACGVQFHTSWNLDPTAQVSMIRQIGSYLRRHGAEGLWKSLQFIDIGGGFWPEQGEWLNPQNTRKGRLMQILDSRVRFKPVHYHRKASPLDHFAKSISEAISQQGKPLNHLEVWTEPGRWISTPAMHILLKVVDKKGERVVLTDGGINLLGWERPLTEFIPVINLSNPSLREESLQVFGSLCTPHDIWGASVFGERVNQGDTLVIPDQGAYTYSLRQSFIKPKSKVVQYDGSDLEEVEQEEPWPHALFGRE